MFTGQSAEWIGRRSFYTVARRGRNRSGKKTTTCEKPATMPDIPLAALVAKPMSPTIVARIRDNT
ncbi:MAG: hypothetical protein ACR2O4_08225 [Hyphomicrobiaceae bacterium]